MYSAQQLLRLLGLRYLAFDETLLPSIAPDSLPVVDMQFSPTLDYRQIYSWGVASNKTQLRYFHGNTGNYANPPGSVHTSYKLFPGTRPKCVSGNGCPPTELFKSHPEWWWPRDKPTAYGQLCWSNASMVSYITERAAAMLSAQPGAKIISISQNDNDVYCQSPAELAIIKEEGSPMGPLLRAVNAIAKALAPRFPDVAVDTLAYAYTLNAPRITKPEPNVIIRICVKGVNAAYPMTDRRNGNFSRTLRSWFNLTQRIYVWNYVADFGNYLQSFPDYFSLGPNIKYFADHGVRGLFEEGPGISVGDGTDMEELKDYVMAEMMWDQTLDPDELISEFLVGEYFRSHSSSSVLIPAGRPARPVCFSPPP